MERKDSRELNDWQQLRQFIKFCLVGVSNTVISYGCYLLMIWAGFYYMVANIVGFSISVINAYYWSNRYVFTEGAEYRVWWKTFLKTYCSYAASGLVLSNILLYIWIDIFCVGEKLAPLFSLVVTVPFNYALNTLWTYKK